MWRQKYIFLATYITRQTNFFNDSFTINLGICHLRRNCDKIDTSLWSPPYSCSSQISLEIDARYTVQEKSGALDSSCFTQNWMHLFSISNRGLFQKVRSIKNYCIIARKVVIFSDQFSKNLTLQINICSKYTQKSKIKIILYNQNIFFAKRLFNLTLLIFII